MTIDISTTQPPRVRLYVRGDMFGANDQQREVVQRLSDLAEDGRIDDYEVHIWEGRVSLSDERRSPAVAEYERFAEWADDADLDIDPFFDVRERDSFIDGLARELILPVMCLAVEAEEELLTVAPNVDPESDETRSVYDCLDALDALDAPARRVAIPAED